jgi:S1-C subfamily serine protease
MRGDVLDVVLVVAAVVFAVSGYRQGFVVGLLSFFGFFGGALIGLQLAPTAASRVGEGIGRAVMALVVVFAGALIGQALAVFIGSRIRHRIDRRATNPHPNGSSSAWHGVRVLDSVGGSIVSVVALLLVAWVVAAPLASSPSPWLTSQIKRSAVIAGVDSVMPTAVSNLYTSLSRVVGNGDFPQVFDPLTPTQVPSVAAPDPALVKSAAVTRARLATVKVLGEAPSCNRRLEGSGFVFSNQRVITNAHVVAGVRSVRVELAGDTYKADVVVYDPQRDLAVLRVPTLTAPTLTFVTQPAAAGTDAIVVGFPLDGPYTPTAARVRDRRDITGPNIYNNSTVKREVYTLRSLVRSGNSGGPLLAQNGQVYGVIFAVAADNPDTGFALSAAEAAPVVRAGRTAQSSVSTGACD